MPKNKQSNLIASVKTPNIGFLYNYNIHLGIRGEGAIQCWLITNHFSQISFHKLPPQLFFFIKFGRSRLLRVSFIE